MKITSVMFDLICFSGVQEGRSDLEFGALWKC